MRRTSVSKRAAVMAALTLVASLAILAGPTGVQAGEDARYVVVFAGTQNEDGSFELGGDFDLHYAAALALVASAGGSVAHDLAAQIGVMVVESDNALFAEALRASSLVDEVGKDFVWKAYSSYEEALARGQLRVVPDDGGGGEEGEDPLESQQWSMQMIRAPQAHSTQAGWRAVDVGILDTGIEGLHLDFQDAEDGANVDCGRGRDFIPYGPGAGSPLPCVDNNFHGTHVAGIVAAQANGHGVVGVAPNVTLVPVKVCDAAGYCYAASVAAGITYAGDAKLDVINMSFFADDGELLESTEFKCMDDPEQRAFRKSVERAVAYARHQGVAAVAALGNSDSDLGPEGGRCAVAPVEAKGVVGTMSLGPSSEKASYSSYGYGATDVGAPGGNGQNGNCTNTVLSTLPGNVWGCIQGTSMASPHAAGVAALIVSQFGTRGEDGDVVMSPAKVEDYLESTAIDIGLRRYDMCFGNGRVDAVRAVQHDTSYRYDPDAPFCPEYDG
jgi:subtilisin family serine protease